MSYAKQVIKLDFPDLSEDPEKDPIWVVIRNPKLLPPKMLRASREAQAAAEAIRVAKDRGQDAPDGDVADTAMNGTSEMAGRLVVAWRVPDPSAVPGIDPLTGEVSGDDPQQLLPSPSGGNGASAEQFGALPMEIQKGVLQAITDAINPPPGPEAPAPTSKMSSGQPSPSSTEPGAEAPSQPS